MYRGSENGEGCCCVEIAYTDKQKMLLVFQEHLLLPVDVVVVPCCFSGHTNKYYINNVKSLVAAAVLVALELQPELGGVSHTHTHIHTPQTSK